MARASICAEWAELFHEVQRQAGPFVGGCVRDAEGRFEPGGVQRAKHSDRRIAYP